MHSMGSLQGELSYPIYGIDDEQPKKETTSQMKQEVIGHSLPAKPVSLASSTCPESLIISSLWGFQNINLGDSP